jgi:flagellum-specific peptidoglycan hydrolase FlgJ
LEQEGLSDSSRVAFIEKYAPAAMEQQCRYGIPASVTLAQMVFESKWGQSKMAILDHNYFGIKANSKWLANGLPYNLYDDDKPNEKFCVFSDAAQSMEYHSQILLGDRYARCFLYPSTDWYNWLVEIIKAGYATSDIYVKECSRIIEKYRLYEYDQMAMNAYGQ